jgi:hypothetical protein
VCSDVGRPLHVTILAAQAPPCQELSSVLDTLDDVQPPAVWPAAACQQSVISASLSLSAAGGLLGVNLAFHHPEHVKGLVLLNAAPAWNFWCSGPPVGQEPGGVQYLIRNLLQIDGTVPAPKVRVLCMWSVVCRL